MLSFKELISEWSFNSVRSEKHPEFKRCLTKSGYWKEFGGNFFVKPRQSGKTTALKELARYIKMTTGPSQSKILVVVPNFQCMKDAHLDNEAVDYVCVDHEFFTTLKLNNIHPTTTHLLIDELYEIDQDQLERILDHDWISVHGVGTLK